MLIPSVSAFPPDSQRDFAPRPGSAYVTDEIWRKAGKNTVKFEIIDAWMQIYSIKFDTKVLIMYFPQAMIKITGRRKTDDMNVMNRAAVQNKPS